MSARAIAIHGNEKSGERRANLEIKSECPALVYCRCWELFHPLSWCCPFKMKKRKNGQPYSLIILIVLADFRLPPPLSFRWKVPLKQNFVSQWKNTRAGHSLFISRFALRSPLISYPWIAIPLALIWPIFKFAHRSIALRKTSGSLSEKSAKTQNHS